MIKKLKHNYEGVFEKILTVFQTTLYYFHSRKDYEVM